MAPASVDQRTSTTRRGSYGALADEAPNSVPRTDSAVSSRTHPLAGEEWTHPEEQESAQPLGADVAENLLRSAGGQVEFDPAGRLVGVSLARVELTPALLETVGELTELQWLDLRGTGLTDADLVPLRKLESLELLTAAETAITDQGLVHLTSLANLRFVSLDGTRVTDHGLLTLSELPRLEGVSAIGSAATSAGARALERRRENCRVLIEGSPVPEAPGGPQTQSPAPTRAHSPVPGQHPIGEPVSPDGWSQQAAATPPKQISGDPEETRQQLAVVLKRKLMEPDVLAAFGQHQLAERKYDQAAETYARLLQWDPRDESVRYQLAVALGRSGRYEASLPQFVYAVGDAPARFNLGVIAAERGERALAVQFFEEALSLDPGLTDAANWLTYLQQPSREPVARPSSVSSADEAWLYSLLQSAMGSGDGSAARGRSGDLIRIVPAGRQASGVSESLRP
jgi:hypothetical protein